MTDMRISLPIGDQKNRTLRMKKDIYTRLKEYCEANALIISRFIQIAIKEKLDRHLKEEKEKKKEPFKHYKEFNHEEQM